MDKVESDLVYYGIVFVLIVWGFLWWQIFNKARYRYPLFMGLVMCMPPVNIFLFIVFAFQNWPIKKQIKKLHNESIEKVRLSFEKKGKETNDKKRI